MFRRNRKTSDFSAEIEAHIQLEIERLREQGLSEKDARPRAAASATWLGRKSGSTNPVAGYGGIISARAFASACACSRKVSASLLLLFSLWPSALAQTLPSFPL
jgi:hypothetical protein